MSPLRLNYFNVVYLSLCLVSLHVSGSVYGFALVVDSTNGSLLMHNHVARTGVHRHPTCILPRGNHPPFVNLEYTRSRRLKKRDDFSHASALNAIPITANINIRQSIYMGLLHLLLGSLGTPTVAKAISIWYSKIDKPKWTPPNRIFAPTWTILYTVMGMAFSRILQQLYIISISSEQSLWKHPLLFVWVGHMLLNIVWAPIFFGLQQLRAGLYINCGLLFSLCGIIIPWYTQIDIIAAYMVIPYAIWLSYATCLNRSICLRNPGPYNTARFYSDLYKLQQQAAKYASS